MRQSEIDEMDADHLVDDINALENGSMRRASSPHWKYQQGLCKVKQSNGKTCGVGDMWRRVCVWQGNERVIAIFCMRHDKHTKHFGYQPCSQCGLEEKDTGGDNPDGQSSGIPGN